MEINGNRNEQDWNEKNGNRKRLKWVKEWEQERREWKETGIGTVENGNGWERKGMGKRRNGNEKERE